MSAFPTKYVPVEYSGLGVAALVLAELRPNDTVSSLWDRIRTDDRVRTFDRYADALTFLFSASLIDLQSGILARRGRGGAAS